MNGIFVFFAQIEDSITCMQGSFSHMRDICWQTYQRVQKIPKALGLIQGVYSSFPPFPQRGSHRACDALEVF